MHGFVTKQCLVKIKGQVGEKEGVVGLVAVRRKVGAAKKEEGRSSRLLKEKPSSEEGVTDVYIC